jgi:cobalt-zinc-cadmium efflux system outer membrane protein
MIVPKTRRTWPLLPVACCSLAFLTGCAAGLTDGGWQRPRSLGADLPAWRAPLHGDANAPAVAEPRGPLTLRAALALSMLHNPDLAGTSYDVRIAEARRLQASLPPNPEIGFDIETFGALSAAESVLQLGQAIFLTDKLARQQRVAALDRDLAGWDYEAKRLAVLTDTAKAFAALLAAQEKLVLAEELSDLSERIVQMATQRVSSGKAAPLESMKAKIELGTVHIQREQAAQAVQAARRRLAATWGATQPRFARAEGTLAMPASIPDANELVTLLEQNPSVARWATEMQRRQAVARLEQAKAIPDLTVGGGWKREGGRNGWAGGVSISLPVLDRNQGGIAESRYSLAKAAQEQRAAQATVNRDLADAYEAMAAAHASARLLEAEVLPEARKAFDASREGYQQGKFAYLDVLDAQRTLFDARSRRLAALADYHAAAANVEGLIGQALAAGTTTNEKLEKQP